MIKLFACDLDGSLLNKNHMTDEVILSAIDQVIESGRYFVVATGRNMHENARRLNFGNRKFYTIAMNGAIILDPEGEIVYSQEINQNFVDAMLKEFSHLNFSLIGKKYNYLSDTQDKLVERFNRMATHFGLDPRDLMVSEWFETLADDYVANVDFNQALDDEILKINVHISDKEENRKFTEFLERHADEVVNSPYQSNDFFEITNVGVHKGSAIVWLAERLGIEHHEINVYGDEQNDLEMLSMFENSYVTANGSDKAKAAANHQIGYAADHAVPKHMLATIEKDPLK